STNHISKMPLLNPNLPAFRAPVFDVQRRDRDNGSTDSKKRTVAKRGYRREFLMNFSQITKAPYQIRGILRNQKAVTWRTARLILLAVFTIAGMTYGQNTNATIRGQVLDPQGALVADAKVLIVNQDTGVTIFQGNSDSVGAFVAPQVIPGTYEI